MKTRIPRKAKKRLKLIDATQRLSVYSEEIIIAFAGVNKAMEEAKVSIRRLLIPKFNISLN